MSHRRRVLNLVLRNKFTRVHSLCRFNLLSRQNSLFYRTAKAAEDAAAAKDPNLLFADADDLHDHPVVGDESLEKVEEMRVPPPALSFEPAPPWSKLDCAGLSETRVVFVDRSTPRAFLYDAADRRVVTMAGFPDRQWVPWRRAYFPFPAGGAAGDKGDSDVVYAIDRDPLAKDDATNWLKFQAMAHRGGGNRWRVNDLPRPPFVDGAGYRSALEIVSYAVSGANTICMSTEGRGTHCFDTAVKARDS